MSEIEDIITNIGRSIHENISHDLYSIHSEFTVSKDVSVDALFNALNIIATEMDYPFLNVNDKGKIINIVNADILRYVCHCNRFTPIKFEIDYYYQGEFFQNDLESFINDCDDCTGKYYDEYTPKHIFSSSSQIFSSLPKRYVCDRDIVDAYITTISEKRILTINDCPLLINEICMGLAVAFHYLGCFVRVLPVIDDDGTELSEEVISPILPGFKYDFSGGRTAIITLQ